MIERRIEERIPTSLSVRIWGLGSNGERFEQDAVARNISAGGALLSGINQQLRPKDLIVVQYQSNTASFRVVWTRPSENDQKILAAVQRREADECPWRDLLREPATARLR
jgi:hypothetical protein